MRHYELVTILSPMLNQEQAVEAWGRIKDFITNREGEIVNERSWGTRRLAYPIRKGSYNFLEGSYYLTQFNTEKSFNRELETFLRLDERVLRSLVIATGPHAPMPVAEPAPAVPPAPTPATTEAEAQPAPAEAPASEVATAEPSEEAAPAVAEEPAVTETAEPAEEAPAAEATPVESAEEESEVEEVSAEEAAPVAAEEPAETEVSETPEEVPTAEGTSVEEPGEESEAEEERP